MAHQYSVAVRNAQLATLETAIGTAPKLQIRTGAKPADCATAAAGTLLCEIALPSDWLADPSGGAASMAGSWAALGVAAGNAGHFRILDTAGTTCHIQGTVTATGGGGDLTLNNVNIAVDQEVSVVSFTLTRGNA
jgi:hypothetical protein